MDKPQVHDDRWSAVVSEIYRAAAGAVPVASALEGLAELTQSDKAFTGWFDFAKRGGRIEHSYNADRGLVQAYNSGLSGKNVWFAEGQYFQAEGLVWDGARIVPLGELARSEFFAQFLAPQAILHTLHVVIAVEGSRVAHTLLTRRPTEPGFGEDEMELCRGLALHARRALDINRVVGRLALIQSGLTGVVNDAALGVAIIEPPATVVYACETFETMISELLAQQTRAGLVGFPRNGGGATARLHLPKPLADAIGKHNLRTTVHVAIERPDADRPLIAQLRPFQLNGQGPDPGRTALAVTLQDPDQQIVVDEDALKIAFQTTASESRVCSLLAAGDRIEEVAVQLGISPHTARSHLKRIFEKTGSNRQSELVKLMMTTARRRPSGFSKETNESTAKAVVATLGLEGRKPPDSDGTR